MKHKSFKSKRSMYRAHTVIMQSSFNCTKERTCNDLAHSNQKEARGLDLQPDKVEDHKQACSVPLLDHIVNYVGRNSTKMSSENHESRQTVPKISKIANMSENH